MGEVSALFAHKVVGAAIADRESAKERRDMLLASVGIDPCAPVDPKQMVPDSDYYGLCERVVRDDPEGHSLSLRVGGSMRCDDYGAFGLAWKSAVDLRGSYERAVRYALVLTSVSTYELASGSESAFLILHREGERRLGLRLSNEQTLASIMQISQEVCQVPFRPDAVYFKHDAPRVTSAHEDYFGCPVNFRAEHDAIEVSEALLRSPNRLGDAGMMEFFDTHLDQELAGLADDQGLERRVRIQVSKALSEGIPSLPEIAVRLGMSGRTLQRRLAERGHAYNDLVDAARRELAERLLSRSLYSLAEVAFLTGYAEQSTFSRAFKRWSGQTPAEFRRAAATH
jgi:AraC-like DNA-binding protein